jgi:hypothetical protein
LFICFVPTVSPQRSLSSKQQTEDKNDFMYILSITYLMYADLVHSELRF